MASWSHYLPVLPLLLLLLLVGVAPEQALCTAPKAPTPAAAPAADCSASFPSSTCPAPRTVQGFNLSAYVGKWYEIGSTGRFKLGTESGLACVFANYTLAEAPTATEGANVTVLNTGVQVLGSVAAAGVRELSDAITEACSVARKACGVVAPGGPVDAILEQVKALSATLSAEDSSIVTSAVADIATSLKSLRSKIASVAAALKQITLKAGDLSQAVGNQASQLKRFVALVRAAELDALAVARNVRDIHGARSRFIPVARSLLASSPANSGTAFALLQAYSEIGSQEEDILGYHTEIAAKLRSLNLVAADLIAHDSSAPLTQFALPGYAEQSAFDPAKLRVFFPMPGVPDPTGGPYWVVAITGQASQGYEAALVYSCTELQGGELDTGLFILSRTRTLASQVVDGLLAKAASFGFSFGCDNPFLFTVQDHPACS